MFAHTRACTAAAAAAAAAAQVPFAACVERFAAPEEMADVFSPALGRKVPATRTTRLASFPPYLMLSFK